MISALLSRFWKQLAIAGTFLLGALALYFRGKKAGEEKVNEQVQKRDVEEAKQHAETIREVADAQSNVIRMSDRQLDERLRKWARPPN